MRLLVAIKSCVRDADSGCHQAIRETWGKDLEKHGVDLRFFVGGDLQNFINSKPCSAPDTYLLNCPDDYDSLPLKTKAILRWSRHRGYDFSFLCDTDSFLIVSSLMSCGFQNYDYSGRFGTAVPLGVPYDFEDSRGTVHPNCYLAASGGIGYFVSRKAAEIIVQHEPNIWAEDIFVANVLGPHIASGEIKACDLPEFECSSSWHLHHSLKINMTTPEMQREAYRLGTPSIMYEKRIKELREQKS